MNKSYFIINQFKQKKGAFTRTELIGKINPKTLVWCEGMEEWRKAEDVEDLEEILSKTPPKVPLLDLTNLKEYLAKIKTKIIQRKAEIIDFSKLVSVITVSIFLFQSIFILLGIDILKKNGFPEDNIKSSTLIFFVGFFTSLLDAIIITSIWKLILLKKFKLVNLKNELVNFWNND